jgi:hypothetical protein
VLQDLLLHEDANLLRPDMLRCWPDLLQRRMLRCWSGLQQQPLLRFWCAVVRHCMLSERQLLLR